MGELKAADRPFQVSKRAVWEAWAQGTPREDMAKQAGKSVRFTDDRGRWRLVRIVRVGRKAVLVDTNHRWAGQTLKLHVKLIMILGRGGTSDPRR